jgi:ATP-dependent RNA helicase RhlE
MSDFATLGLSASMKRSLEHINFTNPTPIQVETIPLLLQNRDLIGIAQTGSGKTAAFVIPLLEKLAMFEERALPQMPRALILAPTRELAIQTTDRIKELSVGMRASCCTIYGGAPYRTQTHILRRGVDILVSTPGRLLDHMKQGNVFLDQVEYFVLDEADRMLDLGFVDDVRRISSKVTKEHQSVMFSATMNSAIRELTDTLLKDPAVIEVSPQAAVANNLDHWLMHVPGHQKRELLEYLIETEEPTRAIVFVRTRREADETCEHLLSLGLKADAIHGDKPQKLRQRTINGFRDNRFKFLVATDVAARGIDVKDISHVFNMDVPVEAESYIHRIGRTARGGASGRAFTLCSRNEGRLLRAIEDLLGYEIDVIHEHPYPLVVKKRASISPKKRPAVARKKAASKKSSPKRGAGRNDAPKDKKAANRKTDKSKGKRATTKNAQATPGRAKAKANGRSDKPSGRPTSSGKKSGSSAGARPRKTGGGPKTGRGSGSQPLRRR